MGDQIKITDEQIVTVLAKLMIADKKDAEKLIERARKAAKEGTALKFPVDQPEHGRGVAC